MYIKKQAKEKVLKVQEIIFLRTFRCKFEQQVVEYTSPMPNSQTT